MQKVGKAKFGSDGVIIGKWLEQPKPCLHTVRQNA